ncbi:MAG: hypothetical protein J7K75_13290 [Desulfuromonas sp.]|nr:hypothetical protein [Desulfuromonas sp.]
MLPLKSLRPATKKEGWPIRGQSDCPVKRKKNSAILGYETKALRLARRRATEQTASFREIYHYRAGIEATNSDLDRHTGIK